MAKKDEYGYTARTFLPAAETAASGRSASASGGKKRGAGYDNEGLTKAQVQELQGYFGAEADGLWGAKSTAAAGGLGAQAAWAKYTRSKAAPAAAEIGGGGQSGFRYAEAPRYTELYRRQSDALAREILSRGPFTYDPETDPAFAAYRRQYAREGQRAAADALGQYAAMTGGVPSTAAVTAARQAGDYYAAKLSDKVPELYKLAYQMYADEGDRQLRQASLLRGLESDNYERFTGALGQYNRDRAFDYGLYRDEAEDAAAARKLALEKAKLAAKYGDYRALYAL